MRNKFTYALFALIGLGSFVVLGNSPQFVSGLIVSMENSPITAIFSSPNPSERSETSYPQPLNSAQEPSVTEIPQKVLWQMVFIFSKKAEREAEKVNGSSDEAMLWRNYFTRQGKLSAQNDSVLKETASKFLEEIEPLDQKAKEIIEKSRAKYRDAKSVNREDVLPPNELGDLQRRRDEITLRYRDLFRDAIGDEAFHTFSTFLAEDFSRGAKQSSFPDQSGGTDSLSPQVWVGFSWIIWDDGLIIPLITGLGGTYFDYNTGFYYDPWVGSILYNYNTGNVLHTGTDKGFSWLYPAVTFHPVYPTTRNNWYCVYSEHWALDRIIFRPESGTSDMFPVFRPSFAGSSLSAPEDAYPLGYTEVCHLVQQCQGFSPTDKCPDPTPTPTPSPTPIEIKTVGFGGDFEILKFAQFSDVTDTAPPISDPTWTRGSSTTNMENVVAYTKGTETTKMKLSATFDVNPPPPAGDGFSVKVRIKYNGDVKATTSNSTSVTGSTFSIQDLQVTVALETTPKVKKGNYTFSWEVSVDNGQTWRPAGNSEHVIYWTYADPINPQNCRQDGTLRNCTFVNGSSSRLTEFYEYEGLYDKALEMSITSESSQPQTKEDIAKELAKLVDSQAKYVPGFTTANLKHPLKIFTSEDKRAQCSANTSLLQGLLRSIGIDSKQILFGEENLPT